MAVDVGYGQVASPQGNDSSGQRLNIPPPQPPDVPAKAKQKGDSLVDSQLKGQARAGLGGNKSNPQIMAMGFVGMIRKGYDGLSALFPRNAAQYQMMAAATEQVVPQDMASQLSGIDQSGAPVSPPGGIGIPPAGGVGGAPAPPPPFPPMAPVAGA